MAYCLTLSLVSILPLSLSDNGGSSELSLQMNSQALASPSFWTLVLTSEPILKGRESHRRKPEVGAVLASLSSPRQREPRRLALGLLASVQLSTLSRSGCVLSKFSLYMILSSLPESLWIYLLPALSPTLYLASFRSFFRSVCSNLVIGFLLCWENMGLYVLASQTLLADGYENYP